MARHAPWRALVPVVALVAGFGFATSARDSNGTDLRAPGIADLADTVHRAEGRVRDLDTRSRQLQTQVDALTKQVGSGDSAVAREQQRVDPLLVPGGLKAVTGPGVQVVLDDAPASQDGLDDPDDANQKVVHQSDLQAVVNALWAGGAEAMSIAGQRVIATSAVRCVGNTLLLNGEVYSPPFRVAAIGPATTMLERLDASRGVRTYKEAAEFYGLGWTVGATDSITLPAYRGPLGLTYARPAR